MKLQPIILSGGHGSRLWPLSRQEYPKQLYPFLAEGSLFQETCKRINNIGIPCNAPIIIANQSHRFWVAEQLRQLNIKPQAILLEPLGKNTAPAIAVACQYVLKNLTDSILWIMPADHVLGIDEPFITQLALAKQQAGLDKLVTFGIVPDQPLTGYGYIKKGKNICDGVFEVSNFTEKPNLQTAKSFIASEDYVWNSGMFMFTAQTYLTELNKFAPEIIECATQSLAQSVCDLDFIRLNEAALLPCPDASIDYALMEKTKDAVMIPLNVDWSDVGSWNSLEELFEKDENGNVTQGDVVTENVKNCFLRAENRLLTAVGVEDHVIVETEDSVLVAHKSATQDIKKIVDKLRANNRKECLYHQRQYRPWGYHQLLICAPGYEVREVLVKPFHAISMQKHQHRSEHWVILEGSASITKDHETMILQQNHSFFVPPDTLHCIENKNNTPLIFIEVQVGRCIKEDDIERVKFANQI